MTPDGPAAPTLLIFDRQLLEERRYWTERLADLTEIAALRPTQPRPGGDPILEAAELLVPEDTRGRLARLTRGSPFLTYAALLATVQVALYKVSGCRTVVVGSPARAGADGANVLAIREAIDPATRFRDLLVRTAGTLREAYAHQRYPYARLLRDLGRPAGGARGLFDVLVALRGLHGEPGTLEPAPDLALELGGEAAVLHGRIAFRTDRLDRDAVESFASRVVTLLDSGLRDPGRPVAHLSMLSDAERNERLRLWPRTGTPFAGHPGVETLVQTRAREAPDAIALSVVAGGGTLEELSYGALVGRAGRLAARLRRAGVGPEVVVGICLPRSPELLVAVLAVLQAGGAFLPLDPGYPRERLAFMLRDAGVRHLVSRDALLDGVPREAALIDPDREALDPPAAAGPPRGGAAPDRLAYVIYTSGSTGLPKGVAVAHRGLVNLVEAQVRAFGVTPRSRVVQLASLSFDAAVSEILMALGSGARLCLGEERALLPGPDLVRFLRTQGITHATIPPSSLAVVEPAPLPALEALIVAGETCPPTLIARWAGGRRMYNAYGPTETTICATIAAVHQDRRPDSVGPPLANLRTYVLDADGAPVPLGVPGELHVGGVGVARGYLRRPALTAERFVPDPFAADAGEAGPGRLYRTGDRARYLPGGAIAVLGRLDHQVKVRGYRIEPGEVEAVLAQHEGVRQAVVVAREDQPGERRLTAYVVPRAAGAPPPARALRAFLQARLPDYMVPAAFVTLAALPVTPAGKVDRGALRPPAGTRPDGDRPPEAPRSATEEILTGLWARLLHVDAVSATDDFFQLGGHSLLATQLVSQVRDTLGVDGLAVRDVFELPTVAGLARRIDDERRGAPGPATPPIAPGPRTGALPLSFAQQRLWVLEQIEGPSSTYNLPIALRLDGPLDDRALRRALAALSARHEVLRTRFPVKDGVPGQVIEPPGPVALPLVDLSALPRVPGEAALDRAAAGEAARPFDLAGGPLLRGVLFRQEPRAHVLLLTLHHVVTDGWSMGILVNDLSALYEAAARGRPASLPPLPVQYADFARWQRTWLSEERLDAQLAYWRRTLAGAPALLELPADRPRPAVQTFRGATVLFAIPAPLARGVRDLARAAGSTLYMTLLAGFQALIHRYTGQDDVVVGTDVANRTRAETEGLVGFFVNQLALRTDLSGNPSFRELLGRVREVCLDAYAHQDLPFQRLLDALALPRDLSRTPLFQVKLLLQNVPSGRLDLPGLSVREFPVASDTTTFDLVVAVTESPKGDPDDAAGLGGFVTYRTELFDEATIRRLVTHWQEILTAVTAEPTRRLADLPLVAGAERDVLLALGTGPHAPADRKPGVPGLVAARAAACPDTVALRHGDHEVTYRVLDIRARALAGRLRRLGVGPEVPVAVFAGRSPEMVAGLLAVLYAGGAYLPLDPAQPLDRLAAMLEDAAPPLVLTEAALEDQLPALRAQVLHLDDPATWAAGPDGPGPPAAAVASPEQLAYVIYTSGSTGRPKAVLVPHRGLSSLVAWHWRVYETGAADRATQLAGTAFDASVWELWPHLAAGASVTLVEPDLVLAPAELREFLVDQAVTVTFLPTPLAEAALRLPWPPRPALRRLLTGGDRLHAYPPPGLPFDVVNNYGPTESTVVATWTRLAPAGTPGTHGAPPIGRPVDGGRVHVLDGRLRPLPVGIPGELLVGGPGLARGYLGRPGQTAERFVPDPLATEPGTRLYRTGDLGRYTAAGQLEYLGRLDSQVSLRGFRVELGEVESALARHPGVTQAVVVVRQRTGGDGAPADPVLVAYVVPGDGPAPDAARLREFLRSRLPAYMVPAAFIPLAAIPLTPNGKPDRQALPDPDRPAAAPEPEAPRDAREATLARIWAGVLKRERVGIHENFFELGGDSILSIQIVARAAQEGLRLTARQTFQHQTIAELAAAAETAPVVEAEQGPVTGPAPLTPIQRWFFEQDWRVRAHYTQSMLLSAGPGLEVRHLEEAFGHVLTHHDALRLRFEPGPDGWRQTVAAPGGPVPFARIDLSGEPEEERPAALAAEASRLQASLDLAVGPLARLAWFDLGARHPGRLLLIVHHLAVDTVSWRILLEDLATAAGQLHRGEAVRLPAKTTAFRDWARRLAAAAAGPPPAEALAFWAEAGSDPPPPLPVRAGADPEANTAGAARTVTVSLTDEETAALLRDLPRAAGAQVPDALLAALLLAVHGWTGQTRLLVDLEGHGRDDLLPGVDLSRTVGWFTALYPVTLDLEPAADVAATLARVLAQAAPARRLGPHHGVLRYLSSDPALRERITRGPRPEISLNYLGQMDATLPAAGLLGPAAEGHGPTQDPRERRPYLLEVGAVVASGRLHVDWRYGPSQHRHAEIERLAQGFLAALRQILAGLGGAPAAAPSPASPGPRVARRPTPADFPLARLDQATLDRLLDGRTDVEDIYPLSPMQQGMLYHSLLEPDAHVFFEQVDITLKGDVDPRAFARAWQAIVERHPAWRTALRWTGLAEPLQIVQVHATLPWEDHDWRGLAPPEREARLAAWLAADRARGLPLDRAPLMRGALVRVGDDRWRFVWTHHHVMMDGWCLPVLMGEAFALHEAFRRGEPPALEPVRPYREFMAWLSRQDRGAAERFWRERLRGFRAPTSLRVAPAPPLPPDQAKAYARVERLLPAALTARLRTLARTHRLTLNILVQGAWALLLARYSGRTDVVFGATTSGRPPDLPGVERMIGLFLNTVPVRVAVPDDEELIPWLQGLLAAQLEREPFAHAPLVDVQGWSEIPRGTPLFESFVVFENYPVDDAVQPAGGVRIEGLSAVERIGYPLTLLAGGAHELSLDLVHDTSRFETETVARMLEHLEALLQGFADDPWGRLADRSLLPDRERRALRAWNDTARDYPREATLPDLFETWAARTPDAAALAYEEDGAPAALTYAQLNARANRLARRLRAAGVGPEVPVAVLLPRSPGLVTALLAVLKAGGAYVPLEAGYPEARLRFMLEDAGAPVVLTDRAARHRVAAPGRQVLCVEDLDLARERPENPAARVAPDGLAYVIYTSGSTGQPKGSAITHRNVVRFATSADYASLSREETFALLAPVSFDASTIELWGALLNGARLALFPPAPPSLAEVAAFIDRHQVTTMWLTAGLFTRMVDHHAAALGRLRTLLAGGDALSPRHVRALLAAGGGVTLVNGYGPTENTVFTACHRLASADALAPDAPDVPIGRPIPNTRVHVLDARLRPVPIGVAGELCAGGDGVGRGFHRRPGLTADRFVPDAEGGTAGARLYRSGDEARWRPDGLLSFLGRLDWQVKVRGFRVEPGEVEAAIEQHPAVRQAVVVPRDDAAGTRQLAAYVVPEPAEAAPGAPGLAEALRRHLRGRLPDYMVPASVTVLDTFPLTPNGKVDRRALPSPGGPGAAAGGDAAGRAGPRDTVELELRHLWEELLDRRGVGVEDSFFALGGHSLLAISLVAAIEQRLGRRLPLAAVMERPTIALQADLLRRTDPGVPGRSPAGPLVRLQPRGRRPPLFCVHPGGGTAFCYLPLAFHLGEDQPVYGLQAPGMGGEQAPLTRVEAMAAAYVAALRTVQPEGPYRLAGWSFGGMVAFEMARQIRDGGQAVAALLLLDASSPARTAVPPDLDDERILRGLAREVGGTPASGALAAADLETEPLLDLARRIRLIPSDAGAQHLAWMLAVFKANLRAATAYRPGLYPGPTTVLRAGAEAPPVGDSSLGWRDLVTGRLEIVEVPGDHFGVVRPPFVQAIARVVAKRLASGPA